MREGNFLLEMGFKNERGLVMNVGAVSSVLSTNTAGIIHVIKKPVEHFHRLEYVEDNINPDTVR
jgi:hypothetical protein